MNIQTSFSYPFLISYPGPSHLLNLKEIRGLRILRYDPSWTEEEGKGVPGEVHEDFRGTECIGTSLVPGIQICVTFQSHLSPTPQPSSEKSLMEASSLFINMKLVWLKKRTSYKKEVEMLRQETQAYLFLQTSSFKMDPLFIPSFSGVWLTDHNQCTLGQMR